MTAHPKLFGEMQHKNLHDYTTSTTYRRCFLLATRWLSTLPVTRYAPLCRCHDRTITKHDTRHSPVHICTSYERLIISSALSLLP